MLEEIFFSECPLCNHKKIKKVFKKKWNSSSFYKCKKCHLIFKNPLEPVTKTVNRYNNDYFKYELENQFNFFNLIKKTIEDFGVLSMLPKQSAVLEIGSATGLFLKYMNENGHISTGLEICKESVDYGIKNYNVNLINKRLEECNFKENSFDFIHFSHLIEHLNDPFNFLITIKKILKHSGYIMLTTPNSSGLFAKYYQDNWRCIVDDHLFIFNKKNLRLIFKKINLKIIKEMTWGSIPKGKSTTYIKNFFDWFVKVINNGDVVAFLLKKI